MKKLLSILSLLTAAAGLPTMACAVDATEPESQVDDNLTAADSKIEREIVASLKGLTTEHMGSESDAQSYHVTSFSLARGETLTDAVMVKRLFPKLQGMDDYSADDRHRASQSETPTEYFKTRTADPVRADYDTDEDFAVAKASAAQWKKVQTLVQARLKGLNGAHLGWAFTGDSSVETGTVALVIAGQTPSGRVIAIYGIVVWT